MEKFFKFQKIMLILFIIISAAMFCASLYFMTDFKDLFGLKLKFNQPIAVFHDDLMQGFNQQFFWFTLFAMLVVFLAFCLEIPHAVPDRFALIVMGVCLLAVIGFTVYALVRLPHLVQVYNGLDFSKLDLEGAVDYQPRNIAFWILMALSAIHIGVSLLLLAALSLSHRSFVKHKSIDQQHVVSSRTGGRR
jgi:hypothetical protein